MSLPYRLYTITSIDLKALGISEEKRTLSYRKNIMVKFSKNGRPYLKMEICYASPGLPASHVRGRLKDRDQTENPRPAATYQYLTDHNKNVTGLTDAQGNLAATWDYDAFSYIIHQTDTLANSNPLRFSSEYHDDDLGLIYYNYRHYNSRDGRWISQDLIEENDNICLYVFVGNKTLTYFDYLGNNAFSSALPISGALSLLDGPLPFGETAAGIILGGAAVVSLTQQAPWTGDCTVVEHAALQNNVNTAKLAVNALGKCKEKDCCWKLKVKKSVWLAEATALSIINSKCFRGGDVGHQSAAAKAWDKASECIAFIISKCHD